MGKLLEAVYSFIIYRTTTNLAPSLQSSDQRHDNSIILQDRHDTVTSDNGIHYEDISANTEGEDIVESQYEGVSAEVSVRYTYIIYIVGLDNIILCFS